MHRLSRTFIVAASLLFALALAAVAQPSISGLNGSELPRSGRVVIEGTGFGGSGDAYVAGLEAWTSTWTDTRIVAYVPEAALLGATTVHVVTPSGQSNSVALTVADRQPDGRVLWTFEADSDNLWYRPARAADGTLYLHTQNADDGLVYALSPDGGLLWIQKVNWNPYVPPTTGPDNEVYVGSISKVYRISRQGEIEWELDGGFGGSVQVAPTIGPDGRLYGVFDGGIGAFAAERHSGAIEWSNVGNPVINDLGGIGRDMKFGPSQAGGPIDQMYFNVDGVFGSYVYAFSLDGDQRFINDVAGLTAHEPGVASDGMIYTPALVDLFIEAIEPTNGVTEWFYDGGFVSRGTELDIAPDDTIYFVGQLGHLEAVDPNLRSQVWRNVTGHVLNWPTVSPDGSILITHGGPTFGDPGFIKGYETADGSEIWSVPLPGVAYPGFRVVGTHRAGFTPDGSTAYLSTLTVGDASDPRSYLYALDVGEPTGIPCADVSRFVARCTASGKLQFGAFMTDSSHNGETVTFDIDGVTQRIATIVNGRGVSILNGQSGTGARTITLLDPAGCFPPRQVVCN